MKRVFKKFLFVALAVVLTLAARGADGKDNNGIDVVLAIDSSGSMKKTDPDSLRIPAAKLFLSLLSEDDRASVMSFSDQGYPISYLTYLNSRENREKLLRSTEKISSRGFYTNLHGALKKGFDVLLRDNDNERSQIIVIMSDGMMDVGDPEEDRMLVDGINNELLALLKERQVRVYSIAFTEQSDRELLERVSRETGGFYNLALADKDFHSIFTSIFESLKAPDMLPMSGNSFVVDNTIKEVTVVATKKSSETKIQLKSPGGNNYSFETKGRDIKWFRSDNFEMITVTNPDEGKWEILYSTGENNKAYIVTDLRLMTNLDNLEAKLGEPLNVKIWLEKEGNQIIEQQLLENIDIYLNLTGPDGKEMKLNPFNTGDGYFLRRIAPFTAGSYKLSVVAKSKTFERKKTFDFNVNGPKEPKEEVAAPPAETKDPKQVMPSEPDPEETEEQPESKGEEKEESDETSWLTLILIFLGINIVIGGAAFIYFMVIKKKKAPEKENKEGNGEQKKESKEAEPEEKKEDTQEERDDTAEEEKIDSSGKDQAEEIDKEPKQKVELDEDKEQVQTPEAVNAEKSAEEKRDEQELAEQEGKEEIVLDDENEPEKTAEPVKEKQDSEEPDVQEGEAEQVKEEAPEVSPVTEEKTEEPQAGEPEKAEEHAGETGAVEEADEQEEMSEEEKKQMEEWEKLLGEEGPEEDK